MTQSLLAVDLGKTGCRVRLAHAGGVSEASGVGAPGLAAPRGAAQSMAAIVAVALPLIAAAGLSGPGQVGVAAAGALAAPEAAHDLARGLCQALGAGEVAVASDATAAHAGALGGAPGVVLAIGTGAVAIAVTAGGVLRRADGWGTWLGDEGSGAWIGLEGLRAALRSAEGRGPATALETRFGPLAAMAARIEGSASPARDAALVAPDVAAAAVAGDAVAAGILRRAAAVLAATVTSAARHFDGENTVAFAITGGLAGLGPILMEPLLAAIPSRLRYGPALGLPLDGAMLLAQNAAPAHESAVYRVRNEM